MLAPRLPHPGREPCRPPRGRGRDQPGLGRDPARGLREGAQRGPPPDAADRELHRRELRHAAPLPAGYERDRPAHPGGRRGLPRDRASRAHDPAPVLRAASPAVGVRSVTRPGRWTAFALAALLVIPASLRGQSAPRDEEIPDWLDDAVDDPLERAHWGVAVYDLSGGRWLASHNAHRHFVPASNLKLLVTAAALERLGPEYTWRTSLYGTAPVDQSGVLRGDLVVYGRGDPNLSGRFEGSMTAVFEALADSLTTHGLRRVTGNLVADASHWDDEPLRPEWESYDTLWWYAAPVGALGFN